jgi:hypothetical protein
MVSTLSNVSCQHLDGEAEQDGGIVAHANKAGRRKRERTTLERTPTFLIRIGLSQSAASPPACHASSAGRGDQEDRGEEDEDVVRELLLLQIDPLVDIAAAVVKSRRLRDRASHRGRPPGFALPLCTRSPLPQS